jgi:hypothetical protein
MTKRTQWPLVVPAGTKTVGTARVRDEALPKMTTAQRRIYEKTGNPPQTAALDDPLDPFPAHRQHPAVITAKKPAKYRNTKCEQDGIKFDSQRERARWFELVQMQVRGEISDLQLQVPFVIAGPCVVAGKKRQARKYVADFVYVTAAGEKVVEDVKGMLTPMYQFKRHLMKTVHNIDIVEIK